MEFNKLSQDEQLEFVDSLVKEALDSLKKNDIAPKEIKLQDDPNGTLQGPGEILPQPSAAGLGVESKVNPAMAKADEKEEVKEPAKEEKKEEAKEEEKEEEVEKSASEDFDGETLNGFKAYLLKSLEDKEFAGAFFSKAMEDEDVRHVLYKSLEDDLDLGAGDEPAGDPVPEAPASETAPATEDDVIDEPIAKSEAGAQDDEVVKTIASLSEVVQSLSKKVEEMSYAPVGGRKSLDGLGAIAKSMEDTSGPKTVDSNAVLNKAVRMLAECGGDEKKLPFNPRDIALLETTGNLGSLKNIL